MRPITFRSLIIFGALFVMGQAAFAVTFTNTPAAVSNTYSGFITLTIGGLVTKETVVVQKYLDINTNGVIDGSDLLVQQFTITDGTNSVIGGVTNINVPGDLNVTAGAITAQLNFQNGDFVQNLVGNYLYKLSSSGGRFTNSFVVTNFPFAQKFTGNVVSNSTSTTLSNAIVLLFPPPRAGNSGPGGNPLAGVVANRAGAYAIMVPAGTYNLLAVATNFVSNFNKAPLLTLGSGLTVTTNLSLTNATSTITGKIVDAANSTIGLPGVFMPLQSTNGLISITFSDTNGNFTARVSPNNKWSLGTDDSGLAIHGYVGSNNGTNVNSGATGVTLAFPKANALFYGSITDSLGNPLAGIDVNAYDTMNNLYQADGYSDANGNYFVGTLGLGSGDPWQVNISSDGSPTNYDFSQPPMDQNGGTNLTAGLAVRQDFTALLATNHITGNVKDSNGGNIAGVEVSASQTIGNTNYQASVDTDANGNYILNVANGTWDINVNCQGGNDSLSQLGSYACPDDQFASISGNNNTNNFVVQICGGVSITTASPLPVGEVNVYYDQFAQASSCNSTFNWSVIAGSFPSGLTGDFSSGEFFGTPTSSGTYAFTVQVSDGANIANKQFSLTISNALQVTTASLPNGTNGAAYSQQLQAVNGVPYGGVPYSWSLVSGSLPANLNLATNGLLAGALVASGQFNFTLEAADNLGGVFDQPLALNVVNTNNNVAPPVSIAPAGGQVLIYYPLSGSNFVLQTTINLATGPWVTATGGVSVTAIIFSNTTAPAQFFRLH